MDWNDFIYACLLLFSLLFGQFLRNIEGARKKQYICSALGAAIVTVVCGKHGLHSLITASVNSLIIVWLSPRISHIVSFIWCFGYIVFFRTTHYLGLPKVPPHANAVQLLLTLKLVGLAFEVVDSHRTKQAAAKDPTDDNVKLQCRFQNIGPTFLDMMLYSYCYVGLLTGPYYKYRTYIDMIKRRSCETIDIYSPLVARIKWIVALGVTYIIISHYYYIEYSVSEEFFARPLWYRLYYEFMMFNVFRVRMYFAWLMSECVCMTAGLGAYPKCSKPRCGRGPTDLQALSLSEDQAGISVDYDFETVHNIDMWGCDLAPTVREGMRSWNMSVQYWLATHIYRRFPVKSMRTTMTMIVSAFWHGIHPGYYLSFLTIPLTLMAEDAMIAAFRDNKPPQQQHTFNWLWWFCRMRFLDYMAMGFLLLSWQNTIAYWSSIYFLPHIVIVTFIVIGNVFKPKGGKSKSYDIKSKVSNGTVNDKPTLKAE